MSKTKEGEKGYHRVSGSAFDQLVRRFEGHEKHCDERQQNLHDKIADNTKACNELAVNVGKLSVVQKLILAIGTTALGGIIAGIVMQLIYMNGAGAV